MKTDKISHETDKNYAKFTKQISEIGDWIEEIKNEPQVYGDENLLRWYCDIVFKNFLKKFI